MTEALVQKRCRIAVEEFRQKVVRSFSETKGNKKRMLSDSSYADGYIHARNALLQLPILKAKKP